MGRDSSSPSPATAVMANADESLSDKRMFAKCVDAVHQRERDRSDADGRPLPRPLWVHSFRLWSLSALSSWDRVNKGLVTAYQRSVLSRFDVVRHLVFGQLLRFEPNPRPRRPSDVPSYDCPAAATAMDRTDDEADDEGREETYEYDDELLVGTGSIQTVEQFE